MVYEHLHATLSRYLEKNNGCGHNFEIIIKRKHCRRQNLSWQTSKQKKAQLQEGAVRLMISVCYT